MPLEGVKNAIELKLDEKEGDVTVFLTNPNIHQHLAENKANKLM